MNRTNQNKIAWDNNPAPRTIHILGIIRVMGLYMVVKGIADTLNMKDSNSHKTFAEMTHSPISLVVKKSIAKKINLVRRNKTTQFLFRHCIQTGVWSTFFTNKPSGWKSCEKSEGKIRNGHHISHNICFKEMFKLLKDVK